ncbi:MAG TPA: hypothetical protein VFF22_09765 [Pseudomonas sp.]|nr:MAG: hypothetical protein A2W44_14160 [Acinetobacter sp. RIFCSPHIGHO2_12_41_5]HZX17133.1 hypothetical protein [Pseudomonas sp.]
MPQEFYEIIKYLVGLAAGAGLTIAMIAKFGEKIFFKHLDHKYSEKLSQRNVELQSELEETKNSLNRSLQQDVASYKADLHVLSGQRARYLERKIDSILELNKFYVFAAKALLEYISTNHAYIDEAAYYFIFQSEEEDFTSFSDYRIYAEIKREHWPKLLKPAESAINQYSEALALRMPILPKEFSSSELALASSLQEIMDTSKGLFYRTMGLTSEIVEPEEEMTPEECLAEFKVHVAKSLELKIKVESYYQDLLSKAQESNELIESLLIS